MERALRNPLSRCVTSLPDRYGRGLKSKLRRCSTRLPACPASTCIASFLKKTGWPRELRNSGVRVKVIAREHAGSLVRIVSQSADFLSGQNVQIIHCHGYKESIVASVLSKWCHIPVQVRTFHGSRTPFTGFKPKHRVALFLDRLTTRHCVDHSITVSSHLANELKPEVGDKISIIKNGVDVNHIVSGLSVEEAKRRLQIPEDALVWWVR